MPSQFQDYFNDKINQEIERSAQLGVSDKYDQVQKAATDKIAQLDILQKEAVKIRELQQNSWVGKLGLDPDGLPGEVVNKAASFVSGASTQLGNLASLPTSVSAALDEAQLNPQEIEAYNRKVQGIATPEDMKLLTTRKGFYTDSPLQIAERAVAARGISNAITDTTNISGIVHSKQRDRLTDQMGMDFQAAWDQTGLANLFEKDKKIGGAKDVAEGLAKLVYNAGEAAVSNPSAATEYVVENLPQLLAGGLLKQGTKLLTAANAGYALDNYNKGMAKYAAENNGAFPPPEERQRMALFAASTAIAEQVGELGQLKAIGKAKKAVDGAADTAKTGVLQSAANVAKAGTSAYGKEALTEGYQTYAEGEAQLKPASAKDIYIGAGIGGLAGGGTALGGRTITEAATLAANAPAPKTDNGEKQVVATEAVTTGDVSKLLDPKSNTYDPAQAIASLLGNAQKDGTAEETKQANFERATQILSDLQEQHDKAKAYYETVSPETVAKYQGLLEKAKEQGHTEAIQAYEEELAAIAADPKAADRLQREVSKLDTQVKNAEAALENFHSEIKSREVNLDVELTKLKSSDVAVKQSAAQNIINLSMASPERVDIVLANELVNDPTNGLTDQQRKYLRAFTEARAQENSLKSLDAVANEVTKGGGGNLGMDTYRTNTVAAIAGGNRKAAERQLGMLENFVEDHNNKAKAAQEAQAAYNTDGKVRRVVSDGKRGWSVEIGAFASEQERRANGGMNIGENSNGLVGTIGAEAQALNATAAELRAAYGMKFNGGNNVKNVPSTPAGNDQQGSKQQTSEAKAEEGAATDSRGTGTGTARTATGNEQASVSTSEEAPASSVNTAEDSATTEEEQVQSTEETTTKSSQDGTLSVFQQRSPEGTSFQLRNLIADYFTQSAGSDTADTKRPLASVTNFLSQGAEAMTEFLKDKTLSVKQQDVLRTFRDLAGQWQSKIQDNLATRNEKFRYEDMMQFLIQESAGKLDVEENVKTAISYAVFSWLAENATRSMYNTDEEINAILERDENAIVSQTEKDFLGDVGTRENVVRNALGRRVVDALGLKASKDAPVNLGPDLEASLGAHAWKLMMDLGLVERTSITGKEMAYLTKDPDTDPNATFHFTKLARSEDGKLSAVGQQIVEASLGSQSILDKLFSVEPGMKEPSFEPIPFVQKNTRNTSQRVPEKLAKIIEHENSVANYVRQDMWQLITQLGEDVLQAMAGVVEVDDAKVHVANRGSLQAKNDGLKREIERFMAFVGGMPDIEAPLYFDHSVWKQQRVGIATNVINPQSSKVHRFLLYRNAWTTKVDINDQAQMDNFRLRVLEGLGVKTDKQSNERSLAGYQVTVAEYADAVEVLRTAIFEGGITDEGQQTLAAAVKAGGEKFHSLDALVALAHEAQAKKNGDDSFTVQMMGEVDGVTNGPMLSHLMLGAGKTADALFGLLNRGGFFKKDSGNQNYNTWRGEPGHLDLYEITALHMTQAVQKLLGAEPKMGPALNAIYAFTGTLAEKDGSVAKAGRKIIKTPLTAMVFGSSVGSAVDSMADSFVDSIYSSIEDVANGEAEAKTVLDHINTLLILGKGPSLKPMSTKEMLEYEFTPAQIKAIKNTFKDTLGKAVEQTMSEDFAEFIKKRDTLNNAAQLSFNLYNATYQGMREDYIEQLVESGELAVDAKGVPLHDLTAAQESALKKRVRDLMPVMHTMMSKDSGSLASGLVASKSSRKLSTRGTFKSNVKFGTPIKGTKVWSQKKNGYVEQSSVEATAYERTETAPGVAMVVMSAHSTDSAISHNALDGNEVLNVHDAHGAGLGNFEQTARNLNKATWDAMLNYSPATEMYEMLSRTMLGLAGLMQREELSQSVKMRLQDVLNRASEDFTSNPWMLFKDALKDTKRVAYEANDISLQVLSELGAVDQYALEGGQYDVTEEDRSAAAAKRAGLVKNLTEREESAVAELVKIIPVSKEELSKEEREILEKPIDRTVFGEVGSPIIDGDPDLVAFFRDQPTTTAAAVIKQLAAPGRLTPINRKILQLLSRTVNPNLTIKLVTPDTAPDEVLEMAGTRAHGWYVAKGDQEAVYLLSPEYVDSGLTAEVVLHELVHAAVAKIIDNPVGDAKALVDELEQLRQKAAAYAKSAGLAQYDSALKDVQEFVAWGMTNFEFQRDVMSKITMESKTRGNRLVTGMQKFIDTLSKLLFKQPDQNLTNGLGVLVSNVSGLFYEAGQAKPQGQSLNLSMAAMDGVDAYTTLDIHYALNDGSVEPRFQTHLANLLGGIVEKLHGPFGAFAASMRKTEAGNPLAVWLKAVETGKAPFASAIVASGFAGSAQEDHAMQQVEATVKAALDGNEATTKVVYRELTKLYMEAKAKLKPSDFGSQEDYDFVFNVETGQGGRSDYLARFAALGLANQKFNKLLQFGTAVDTTKVGEGKTITDRLLNIFEKIVNFFNEKITHTYGGQPADAKLSALVEQLVDIEAKKRHLLKLQANHKSMLAPVEEGAKKVMDKTRELIGKAAGSDIVRKSKSGIVQGVGGVVRVVANDQVEYFIDGLKRLRDREFKGRPGVVASMLTELKGPLDKFNALLRETKRLEGVRKNIITQHAAMALSTFANNGENLTTAMKSGITSVFLRTGMHHLVGDYTLAQLEAMVGDQALVNNAIATMEAKLSHRVKDQWISQANALGYYKATGQVKSPILMLNAYLISRMAGTQFGGQISEQEATAAEATIAKLVSLYALKYTHRDDVAMAKQVFRDELNRQDGGNGVQFVLELHKKLEADSLSRLFKGNPTQMIHGFTPEIFNPHTAIKIANFEEGQDLMNQGYSMGGQVVQDSTDPNPEAKHIYVQRDGGLAPYLTGVFSLTSMKAKGTSKHDGFLNTDVATGLANSQMQVEITQKKVKAMGRKMDPRRDLSKQDGNHMVPVFNEQAEIVNWRYMMADKTKNELLERDNRFENLLGALAGSIFDKAEAHAHNYDAIDALRDQYEAEYATRAESYVLVGPKSPDPALREIWSLLPYKTREYAKDVWGREGMMVRSDSLDIMFGYRKYSLAQMFNKDPDARNQLEKLFVYVMETVLANWAGYKHGLTAEDAQKWAKRAAIYVTRGERAWQELVREAKDIIVIKTGVVMLGNIWSNLSLLAISGVPFKTIMTHHLVAIKAATAWQADSKRLADLETKLAIGYTQGDEKEMRNEVARLQDALARNPVRELIEAGLMPTIVEDVAEEYDPYSYKTEFARKTEKFTNKLNPSVKKAASLVYMTHDTTAYQTLTKITQLSDFVARYTLYHHLIERKNNPLSKAQAIQEASDAFVNYDIPMHKSMQFMDDMGLLMFTKYFMRIQRVLLKMGRENPLRMFLAVALNKYLDLGPIVLDSHFLHHVGNNPLASGALQYPGALDELATVQAAMALVK